MLVKKLIRALVIVSGKHKTSKQGGSYRGQKHEGVKKARVVFRGFGKGDNEIANPKNDGCKNKEHGDSANERNASHLANRLPTKVKVDSGPPQVIWYRIEARDERALLCLVPNSQPPSRQ